MNKIDLTFLSCGRSDFSIYLPLLREVKESKFFNFKIVLFGSHLSKLFGNTKENIQKEGFEIYEEIDAILSSDSEESIASSMGITTMKFANYFKQNPNDYVIVLGDRYEMFAAAAASVAFKNIDLFHLHGGETSLGSIDNIFRDCITRIAKLHFVSTESHKQKVSKILDNNENIFNFGAPALDGIINYKNLPETVLRSYLPENFPKNFVLSTIHPETGELSDNLKVIQLMEYFINQSIHPVVFTLPNNDSESVFLREKILEWEKKNKNIYAFEALGIKGYYAAMHLSKFLIGNSSSGIIEAASFGKFNINIGNRQKGRTRSENTLQVNDKKSLEKALTFIEQGNERYNSQNVYAGENTSKKIIAQIEKYVKSKRY